MKCQVTSEEMSDGNSGKDRQLSALYVADRAQRRRYFHPGHLRCSGRGISFRSSSAFVAIHFFARIDLVATGADDGHRHIPLSTMPAGNDGKDGSSARCMLPIADN